MKGDTDMDKAMILEEYDEEYFNYFYTQMIDKLKKFIEDAKNRPNQVDMNATVEFLDLTFGAMGAAELYYKHNLTEGRKAFYKATLAREWFYNEFPQKVYQISPENVSSYAYDSLYNAILCGNMERARYMAGLFGSICLDGIIEHQANVLLGYGLKYTILDEKLYAMEYIQKIEMSSNRRGMKQYIEGHARAFRGLIERNVEEFNRGLEFMLKHHIARLRKGMVPGRDEFFAYDSVALAMLAKDRGIAITVKHDLLPMEYLENTNINYAELQLFALD